MEARFARGFGDVRVHTDENAARAADSIDALAFTVGRSIWFGRGMYQPDAASGLHLLAHELTHTIQQRGHTPGAQASLRVGAVGDPAEFAAERAADAVLARQPVSRIAASGAAIRRKPKVSPVANDPSRRMVELDDGKKYRVTRSVNLETKTTKHSGASTRFGADIDKENVWIQVDHCEGTNKRTVKIGANVPAAAQSVLKKAGQAILSGADPGTALQGIQIEPSVSVIVAESEKYRVEATVKPTVDIEKGRITGGSAGITAKTPVGDISAEGKIELAPPGQSGPNISGGFTWTIPLEKPPKVECPTFERTTKVPRISYSCEEVIPEHTVEKTVPITLRQVHNVYFEYAKSAPPKQGRTVGLDAEGKAALKAALNDNYRVNRIRGFASPEGPVEPTKRFQGNQKLSEERATAAEQWIESECGVPSALSMRPSCFADDYKKAGATVGGELYGQSEEGAELNGKALAEQAVEEFKTEEGEEPRRTPEVMEELERKKTPERQTDTVYPLLRRAEIEVSKASTKKVPETVAEAYRPLASCPAEVSRAAEEDFERATAVKK
jgi:hypothetical protein